jgi:hypothetical protein
MDRRGPPGGVPEDWLRVGSDNQGNTVYQHENDIMVLDGDTVHTLDVDSEGQAIGIRNSRSLQDFSRQQTVQQPTRQERLRNRDGTFASSNKGVRRMSLAEKLPLPQRTKENSAAIQNAKDMKRQTKGQVMRERFTRRPVLYTLAAGVIGVGVITAVDKLNDSGGDKLLAEAVGGGAGASVDGAIDVARVGGGVAREAGSQAMDSSGLEVRSPIVGVGDGDGEFTVVNPINSVPVNNGGVVIGGSETPLVPQATVPVAPQPNQLALQPAHESLIATAWGIPDAAGMQLDTGNRITKACFPELSNAAQATLDLAFAQVVSFSPELADGVDPGDRINCVLLP